MSSYSLSYIYISLTPNSSSITNLMIRPFVLFLLGHYTAFKIFLYYLTSLSSLFTVGLSVGDVLV